MYLWEELNSEEFKKACKETKGTCIIPFGCIEKHGTHLPLGTDMMIMKKVVLEVAKAEPVMVFPDQPFGQIAEAKHVPGTIAISPELLYKLMDELCKEISRNGFKKIVIVNVHGGNDSFIKYFIRTSLYEKKDYVIYQINANPMKGKEKETLQKMLKTDDLGDHAGNMETALMMAARPDLVKMDSVEERGLKNYDRLKNLDGAYNIIKWYGDHPTHFAGEPYAATPEAGKRALELVIERSIRLIKAIKEDDVALELAKEFYSKCDDVLNN